MTLIVACKGKKGIYFGADSLASNGTVKTRRLDSKLFRSEQGFVYGFAGSIRYRQVVQYNFVEPVFDGVDVDEYLFTEWLPCLRKCLREHEILGEDESVVYAEGTFLLGCGGRLFNVSYDLQVAESHWPFAACGSGGEVALGSLFGSFHAGVSPVDAVEGALEAASEFIVSVGGPFTYEFVAR
jgi:ATP-dependent protease HslVU (ClpYQ) peptidase subunit